MEMNNEKIRISSRGTINIPADIAEIEKRTERLKMNNDFNNKAYPCDEPTERKSYPCDDPAERSSYPCDEAFSDAKKASSYEGGEQGFAEASESKPVKGKGRRGGNSAFSKVVNSGVFAKSRNDRSNADRDNKDFGAGRDRADRGRGFRRDFDGDRREKRDFRDRGEGRSFNDRNERSGRSFDRSGRDEDRRSFNRSDRDHDRDRRFGDRDGRGRNDRGREREKSPESIFSKAYKVKIETTSEIGAFVNAPEEILNSPFGRKIGENRRILLPFAEQLGRPKAGDIVSVHFYEDKGGRMACTMRTPILKEGEVGILRVAASTRIGVFLDNGVPKQVLLPFKEQISAPEVGDEVLVWLYSDKSGRQAATMRVYAHLDKHSPYKEDDRVTGFVYEINPKLGIFIAVDNKYYGLVPINETFKNYEYGDEVEARVAKVREDGKLDLLIREKLYKTVQEDADVILYELRRNNGFLPYGDRADAEFIEETYAMSKNQFKRALGHLYRNRIVELDREKDTVTLIKD